ncbi:MAG: 2Fe-2S iron-sulfur cluster-binding protein [Desulforhopalus sp.]|nr:2Fe-2S iron-sulfur cluster-binding protein [Desulforhopalus sp.]
MAQINIENLQVTIAAQPGRSLLNTLVLEDQPIHTVCGGRARCGCCRIRIVEGKKGISPVNEWEKVRLTAEELAAGWRLACQTHTLRDITIHLPTAEELDPACRKKKERVVQDPALR